MPLYKKLTSDQDNQLVIWNINENKQELISSIKQKSSFIQKLNSIKNEKKQIEFLSTLKLLEELNLTFDDLKYNEFGKPTLQKGFISITHSFQYSGIYYSKKKIGIDIEKFRDKILNIWPKFISKHESELFNFNSVESITKAWTIKESVFKAFGYDSIDFKKDIIIESLKNNKAIVRIYKNEFSENYLVDLMNFSNYICSTAQIMD
ncbi:MAG: 4'-phosphopantetheinyl transferase superfamily protein [Flavobacteriaceae bacterium]|nr:4'-phosphopantetheinyl transferase superfamily protein [Flavobacteriaceae bacterium]